MAKKSPAAAGFSPEIRINLTKVVNPDTFVPAGENGQKKYVEFMDVITSIDINQDFVRLMPQEQRRIFDGISEQISGGKIYSDCNPNKLYNTVLFIDGFFPGEEKENA